MTLRLFTTEIFNSDTGITTTRQGVFELPISTPERAFMECLHLAPQYYDITDLYYVMEMLSILPPKNVQRLLEECRSVKVKRLFLFMAEKARHAWFEALDLDKIDLGSGKRVIAKGGVYDKKYQITIPAELKMISQEYKERVRLLLRIIPIISAEEYFAVHGGTAINLFVQNLPRYSVDIDLTYIPVEPREASLAHIKERLKAVKAKIEATIPGIMVREVPNKLICTDNGHFVKVEVNDVKRGIIAPPIELPLCDLAQEDFGVFCKARIVPLSQLYGGKITAALDRQHPRDLFDVSLMLDYIKDFDQIKRGFIFCLLGSDRPILESLNPNFNDQRNALTNQFEGMSSTPFTYEQYEVTRRRLVEYINSHLTPTDKEFLLGFEDGMPDWDASEYRDFQHYPSIQWKLLNIQKLKFRNQKKHEDGLRKLKTFFFGS